MIKIAYGLTALVVFPMVAFAGGDRVCNLPGKDFCTGIDGSKQAATTKPVRPAKNQAALELDTTPATSVDSWTSLSNYERQMIRAAE